MSLYEHLRIYEDDVHEILAIGYEMESDNIVF